MEDHDPVKYLLGGYIHKYKKKKYSLLSKMIFYKRDNVLNLFYGRIRPLFEDEKGQEERLDFSECTFCQNIIPPERIDELFNNLLKPKVYADRTTKEFTYGEIKFISTGSFAYRKEDYIPTFLRDMKFHNRCRTIITFTYPSQTINTHTKFDPSDIDLPYYPSIKELVKDKFGISVDRYSVANNIHIALAPLSGFISKIQFKAEAMTINVENKDKALMTLKVCGEDIKGKIYTKNFPITNTKGIEIPKLFTKMKVVLIDRTGTLLDEREYFRIETKSVNEVRKWLLDGENVTVDFKLWKEVKIPKEKEKKNQIFGRLLTAFANTEGGVILIGIDNNANIIGIEEGQLDKIDIFLTNICDTKTRPRVIVNKSKEVIDEKIIGVFRVKKSNELVENLYDNHFYIRRGSTNRTMQLNEIKERIR